MGGGGGRSTEADSTFLFVPTKTLRPPLSPPSPPSGKQLVRRAVAAMAAAGADEAVLEAEATNAAALASYERLGFLRDKRLARYYLNGADAFRLKLRLPETEGRRREREAAAVLAAVGVGEEEGEGGGEAVAAA